MSEIIKDYRDENDTGYLILKNEEGYRWEWREPGDTDADGEVYSKLSEALDAAAFNWEESSGDWQAWRRGRVLKAQATVARKVGN